MTYSSYAVVMQEHGVEGFLHGLAPRLLRRALMAAISWTVYEQVNFWHRLTYLALRSTSSLWNNGQQVSPAHMVGSHCLFLTPADS